MAGTLSQYAKRLVLDALLSAQALSIPTLYVAATVNGTEVSGNGYARVAVPANLTNFPAATGSATKSNGTKITFATANGGSWGLINGLSIYDAASGGNLIASGTPDVSKQIDDGDTLEIGVGKAVFTLT